MMGKAFCQAKNNCLFLSLNFDKNCTCVRCYLYIAIRNGFMSFGLGMNVTCECALLYKIRNYIYKFLGSDRHKYGWISSF